MKGTVIFLEAKGTMMEVIRAAHGRGYRVVCFTADRAILQGLPAVYAGALSCVDEIVTIPDWNAYDAIAKAAEEQNLKSPIAGIYYGFEGNVVAASHLRRLFDLPSPEPTNLAGIIDKFEMRQKLRAAGLSKIQSFLGHEINQWEDWKLPGPAYFKPVHGTWSLNVKRCTSIADVKEAKQSWKRGAGGVPKLLQQYIRSEEDYLLEEAFEGELLSVEAISSGGQFHCIGLTSRILFSKDPTVEMGSCFPYAHPLAKQITALVKKAHAVLGFSEGASHTEVIVNSNGDVEIIDFNPRFIGADVLQSINHAYGIKIEESLLDWAVGQTPNIAPTENNVSCIQYILPPKNLVFHSVIFPTVPEVKFSTSFIKPGTEIAHTDRQIDYIGCYLTVTPDFKASLERSRQLRSLVKINDCLEGAY